MNQDQWASNSIGEKFLSFFCALSFLALKITLAKLCTSTTRYNGCQVSRLPAGIPEAQEKASEAEKAEQSPGRLFSES